MNRNTVNTFTNFNSTDPEERLVCPYNPGHDDITAKQFPYHLQKCRKNYTGQAMLSCVFNARHIVLASEFKYHIDNCPDRSCIEPDLAFEQRHMHTDDNIKKGYTGLPTYARLPSPTEDWDRENSAEACVGYDANKVFTPVVFQNITSISTYRKEIMQQQPQVMPLDKQPAYVQPESTASGPGKPHPSASQTHVSTTQLQPSVIQPSASQPSATQPSASQASVTQPSATKPSASQASATQPQLSATQPSATQLQPSINQHTAKQMRLPRHPAKAAGLPRLQQGQSSKRGVRIAANIYGLEGGEMASSVVVPQPVLTPLTDTEIGGDQYLSAFQRPPPSIGHGLVPGLGPKKILGIGRGLIKNDSNTNKD